MKTKLLIVLVLMVCLPLSLLVWLGVRLAREERNAARGQVRDLLLDRLRETDAAVGDFFADTERDLLGITEVGSYDTQRLREVVRTQPYVNQLFVLDPKGQVIHPDMGAPMNDAEHEFLQRARPFLLDRDLVRVTRGENDVQPAAPRVSRGAKGVTGQQLSAADPSHGWYLWYWGRGLNLIFWRRLPGGNIVGVELPRLRWMADLVGRLPNTAAAGTAAVDSLIQLTDSSDHVVYQWGRYTPGADSQPLAELALSEPLSSWRLKYYVADEGFAALARKSIYFNLFTGLAVSAVALLALAVYWYRESSRDLREAASRVNFVNQVSHELKTPLTNIRMYAELLQRDLDESGGEPSPKSARRVQVIMAESSRLSRLIGNVLTFASGQRRSLALKPTAGVVDRLIASVLESFEPTLTSRDIEVDFKPGAAEQVRFDVDAVEQILVNLISNVEKYAAEGKHLAIESRQQAGQTTIRVADRGPGIRGKDRTRVFEPFYRVSDRLEGAAGAGIGLSIARSLAELHGGELVLLESDRGAVFEVRLHTPAETPRKQGDAR